MKLLSTKGLYPNMFAQNANSIYILMIIITCVCSVFIFSSCSFENKNSEYEKITPEEVKEIIDTQANYVILDVRSKEEYDEGHIENAMLLPYDEIELRAEEEFSDKEQLILIYCRSGNRSKTAADSFVSLGYTNIKEFGGISNWPYETVKD